jgi:hypothetical protein
MTDYNKIATLIFENICQKSKQRDAAYGRAFISNIINSNAILDNEDSTNEGFLIW